MPQQQRYCSVFTDVTWVNFNPLEHCTFENLTTFKRIKVGDLIYVLEVYAQLGNDLVTDDIIAGQAFGLVLKTSENGCEVRLLLLDKSYDILRTAADESAFSYTFAWNYSDYKFKLNDPGCVYSCGCFVSSPTGGGGQHATTLCRRFECGRRNCGRKMQVLRSLNVHGP